MMARRGRRLPGVQLMEEGEGQVMILVFRLPDKKAHSGGGERGGRRPPGLDGGGG